MAKLKGSTRTLAGLEIERQKIIENLSPLTPNNLQNIANYLVREGDFEILAEILDGLDANLVGRYSLDDDLAVDGAHAILLRLSQLGGLLHSFSTLYMPVNPSTSIFQNRSLQMILERWGDIAAWMMILLTKISPPAAGDTAGLQTFNRIGASCVTVLCHVVSDADWGLAKEEILSLQVTADVIFALIRRTNPTTGKYSQIFNDPVDQTCRVLFAVVLPYVNSDVGLATAVDRLSCLRSKDQKQIVDALVLRGKHLSTGITSSKGLMGAVQNLSYLFLIIFRFVSATTKPNHTWQLFYRQRFLFHMASSLQSFIQQAEEQMVSMLDETFWGMATKCNGILSSIAVFASPNPIDTFPQAIEGGLVRCFLGTISRTLYICPARQAAVEPLRMLYPFLNVHKIWAAMKKHADDQFFETWKDNWSDFLTADIAEQWGHQISFCRYAYDSRREHELSHLNMCNNEKCPLHRLKSGMGHAPPKICTSCHHVTYCSEACQKEDWVEYHSAECSDLTRLYKDYKGLKRWPPWKTRRDQLIFLEVAANSGWAPLPDLKKIEQESRKGRIRDGTMKPISKQDAAPYDPDSTVPIVDLLSDRRLVFRYGITVAGCNIGQWPRLNVGWHRRIQSCALDAERNPNSVLIVEARFPLDEQFVMWVFAKMTWYPNAEKEKRYKIVTSAHRLGVCKWPEGAGNPWLFLRRIRQQPGPASCG